VWRAVKVQTFEGFDLGLGELPEVFRLEWFGRRDTRSKELK
jgi:hypothetical protein